MTEWATMPEVAYLFGHPWWGAGYAAEAMTWFHAQLAARRVAALWAAVGPRNARSLALLDRLGATGLNPHPHPFP